MIPPVLARLVPARWRKPAPDSFAPATVVDFQGAGFFASRRMSPKEVRLVLERAAAGELQAQWDLFSLMEDSWPRLAKNLAELRHAAARATYLVQPYAERGAKPSPTAKDRAQLVDHSLRQWWPKPGTLELSFENTLFHALDAYGKGISVLELHWRSTGDGLLPRCSHVLAPRRYGWNADGNELGLVDSEGRTWQPFPEDHFLIGLWQARTGAPGATAVLRSLAPYWAGITFGWEWLLSNAQIFGVPFRWATYDKSNPALGGMLRDMLAAMGASGYGAFPDGTKLEFKEAAQNATGNPQVVVQTLANQACDLLILGQELSGAAQAAGLGGGAAGLQQSVRADRLEAAAQWCADLLNYQLVPALLRANYGDTEEPPTIVPDLADDPDPKALAERDKILLDAGVEMPLAWFYERHRIPEPQAGEPVIVGRAPAPMGGGFAPTGVPAPATEAKPATEKDEADLTAEAEVKAKAAEQDSDAKRLALVARTAAQLKPIARQAIAPVLDRLAQIEAMADPAARRTALLELRSAWPQLSQAVLRHVPAVASPLAQAGAAAAVSGLVEPRR